MVYSKYCKIHNYLSFKEPEHDPEPIYQQTIFVISDKGNGNDKGNGKGIDKSNYKKQLIDNSFYYIDDSFIYNTSTLEKVGYIENNEFILTDDPFILN